MCLLGQRIWNPATAVTRASCPSSELHEWPDRRPQTCRLASGDVLTDACHYLKLLGSNISQRVPIFLLGILEQRCPSLCPRPLREAPRAQEIVGEMVVLPSSTTHERNLFPGSMSPRNYFSPRASRSERWRSFRRCSYWLARRLAGAESESRGWWPRLEPGISFELDGSTVGVPRGCEFWELLRRSCATCNEAVCGTWSEVKIRLNEA